MFLQRVLCAVRVAIEERRQRKSACSMILTEKWFSQARLVLFSDFIGLCKSVGDTKDYVGCESDCEEIV